jgi:glycosyltransferase involved in cell wall biosynthesis
MNILFISSIQMWGGGEVFLMDIMHGMKQRGHKVHLLCRPNTELAVNSRKENFEVTTIRMGGDFDPFVIWNARRVMMEYKIDVVCTNMDKDLRFGGLAAILAGVKSVIPSREIDYPINNTLRNRFFYNVLSTHLIVNSEATKTTVLKSAPWLSSERITVIYKGISLEPFSVLPASNIRQELQLSSDAKLVTFVGQLDERKGIHFLLEAWKSVIRCSDDAVLLFIGKGKMQSHIEDFISTNAMFHKIKLLGFRKDIPSILQQSYLLTLPSLWEGFGYVLVEAMAAKLPIVATEISSIPEIIEKGKTGLLVPAKDSAALSKALCSVLDNIDIAKQMGQNGRRVVEEKFTLQKMLDRFEKIFQDSLQLGTK